MAGISIKELEKDAKYANMAPIRGTVRNARQGHSASATVDRVASLCVCVASFIEEIIKTMVQCAITNCRSRSDVHSKMSSVNFHRIPKEDIIRKKWMKAIGNYDVHDNTRICSKHFKKSNYYKTANGLDRLLKTAVPDVNLPGSKKGDQSSESNSSDTEQSQELYIMETEEYLQSITMEAEDDSQSDLNDIKQETEQVTTVNVLGSNIESEIQVYKRVPNNLTENSIELSTHAETADVEKLKAEVRRLILEEKKYKQEVHKLQLLSRKRLEKIINLQEENKKLMKKNVFLKRQLECETVPEEVNKAIYQDSNFFN